MRRTVDDLRVDDRPGLDAFVRRLGAGGGFSAKGLSDAVDVLASMLADPEMTVFLSFPADIVATGTRGVIASLVDQGYVDAVVTTCGTLDHDLARSYRPYYHGAWDLDDATLHRRKLYRLGNLVIPEANYGRVVERRTQAVLRRLWERGERTLSGRRLAQALGESIPPTATSSILRAAADRKVPVFVPGITDGAVGSQLWLFWQDHRALAVDLLSDEQALADLVYGATRTGAIMLGGGISKHHTIWWNQFREGLDAAVYVTTAVEWDGSLSGARTREAISWGKIKARAPHVTVEGDATVLFPLMVGAALERVAQRRINGSKSVAGPSKPRRRR